MLIRLAFLALSLSCSSAAWSAAESVLMPGQVIAGHAKLETKCDECHVKFDKAAQNRLCKDCHKEVKADVLDKKGFHGRLDSDKDCNECHTDHKGRNAKIVLLDIKKFDHEKTDYPLRGAHEKQDKVKCTDCHKTGKKYSEAPSACNDCHQKDDKHKGSLGKECSNCHKETNWKEAKFDHSKTKFALAGKHIDVKCNKCHAKAPATYKGEQLDCYSCHRKDDKHKGQYGKKCETCHVDRSWKKITFDHDRETKYKLLGKHIDAKCMSCHKEPLYKKGSKTPTDCNSCHKKDDDKAHKGNFGPKCETCHKETDWKTINFDHDKDTKYPLKYKHKDVKCVSCHIGKLYGQKLAMDCYSCHKKDDDKVHKLKLGKKCESCHTEKDWKKETFDHSRSRFPLVGLHMTVDCKKCHETKIYLDTPSDCYSCHKKDDEKTHKRRLGKKCETCHNARSWKVWDFEHDTRTKFKLDGAHVKIDCYACHKTAMVDRVITPKTCDGCHDNDDVHRGEFGPLCDRCHTTTKWKTLRKGISSQRR